MKKTFLMAALMLLVVMPGLLWGSEIAQGSLDKLMLLSGLNKQMAAIPGMMQAAIDRAKQENASISDSQLAELRSVLMDAFRPAEMLGIIRTEIKKTVSAADAKEMLTWYESDLGRKITKAEEDAMTDEAYQIMLREAKALLSDEKRVGLARKMDSLAHTTDITTELQMEMAVAVISAVLAAISPDKQVRPELMREQMAANEKQIKDDAERFVIISGVYTYRDIDTADIEKYIEFMGRPSARAFTESALKGEVDALHQTIEKLTKSLSVLFKKIQQKKQTTAFIQVAPTLEMRCRRHTGPVLIRHEPIESFTIA